MSRLVTLILLLILTACTPLRDVTGEEELAPQIRGAGHWASGQLRPQPQEAPPQPIRYTGLYPFGINTFLQLESEPDKVEQSLNMIAEAGFGWIRQEFTWEDLEIHRQGWYVDLRNNNVVNAWAKYDRIVDLAEARDLQIIARLSTPPGWSRTDGYADSDKAPPDNLAAYGDYVAAVVSRYQGRIRYYQIWNEPNCCLEWGTAAVSPEEYVQLLQEAYTRAKAIDPTIVIITAPLAPTIALREQQAEGGDVPALNDFLFLQRMYDAGARDYFDVLAVQDYGLWSGPTDQRMLPRVINYSRPEYIRDLMMRNGDSDKAIWASEIGWNATPPDSGIYPSYGYTPEELRGPYLIAAYERQQREWPWMGVTTAWFFKPTNEDEATQAQYYFRLVNPDFTPTPAWNALRNYIRTVQPTLYRGYHQEDHWVLTHPTSPLTPVAGWPLESRPDAVLGQVAVGQVGQSLTFAVEGERLSLIIGKGSGAFLLKVGAFSRPFVISDDGVVRDSGGQPVGEWRTDAGATAWQFPPGDLPSGRTVITLTVVEGVVALDGILVE